MLVLSPPIINASKRLFYILFLLVLSQTFPDRSSSRWTFNHQSTDSSNFHIDIPLCLIFFAGGGPWGARGVELVVVELGT